MNVVIHWRPLSEWFRPKYGRLHGIVEITCDGQQMCFYTAEDRFRVPVRMVAELELREDIP